MPVRFDVSSFLKSVDFDSTAVKQPKFETLQPISHEPQLVVPQVKAVSHLKCLSSRLNKRALKYLAC